MLNRILTKAEEDLLRDERRLLADLQAALAAFGADADDQATLRQSIEQLDELFLFVVVGEFNAGKSALINALLGERVLEEGATPTTTAVTVVKHGVRAGRTVDGYLHAVTAPLDILERLHIVDTPGTNAVIREHELITARFVPRADLVLFVTSADRPFTESERLFLQQIRDWGKKVLVVINKVDILESAEDLARVRTYVAEHARALLGSTPEIFAVSAREALQAKRGADDRRAASGFEPLEGYLRTTLDDVSRKQLKLANPLGIGRRLLERYLAMAAERRTLLAGDLQTLEDLERELGQYEQDMTRDFRLRIAEIENLLLDMERRGHEYFDEMLRLGRVFDLLNKPRVQQGFEQQVVADTPDRIERRVQNAIDWLVDAEFRQWQAVTAHLGERRREHRGRIVEAGPTTFQYDRSRLIESLADEAQRVVDTYDKRREAQAIAEGARNAVAGAAAAGAGAVGLGTLVTVAATTAAADVTGFLTASLIAALGFFIIPARRRRVKGEMRQKISSLRERLSRALEDQFRSEMQRSLQRIRDETAPYARFVRAENAKLTGTLETFQRLEAALDGLRGRIERLR